MSLLMAIVSSFALMSDEGAPCLLEFFLGQWDTLRFGGTDVQVNGR